MISTTLIAGYEESNKILCSSSDRYKIFRVSKNIKEEWNIVEGFDIGLLRYDNVTSQVDFHSFTKPAHIVPVIYADDIFYYGSLKWNGPVASFSLNKINYRNSTITDDEIYSFEMLDYAKDENDYSNLWRIELYVLSERYVVLAVPFTNNNMEFTSGFSQFILIDTLEKVSYVLPESIGDNDTILRLDTIRSFQNSNQTFVLLQTGRILINEKEELWRKKTSNLSTMLQSVVLMKLDEFVKHIVSNTPIGSCYIIETCLDDSGIVNILVNENMLIVHKRLFNNKTTECVFVDVITGEKKVDNYNDNYSFIFSIQGKLVGYLNHEKDTEIYNLETGKLELSLNNSEMLVDIDMQGSYIVSRLDNNRLIVNSIGARNVTNIMGIDVSSDGARYVLMYNEQINGIVCIL